ncbi:MAG TPA: NAD(P)/FAD-dependent oxidoreductase [Solirubrobacteraceae bacterium]|nr:NAD(P)/FAD-dependent oxidoreductase [Solirubrobacteraceae bacterium]
MERHQGPRIAIVGAGFGGIGMAISLDRAGFRDFEVFERGDRVGGVWRENSYPGAGCDVPSPLYSYSFEPNPAWPWRYSKQESILAYLEHCVTKYGVRDRIRLSSEVQDASFDADAHTWELTVNGESRSFDVLIAACGQLSEPATPNFPGRDSFAGHAFHSAQWDHGHDLTGQRVAVIGTGASAIQFVPEIAKVAAQLHLFQRSAPYVVPKPDREYSPRHHALFSRIPTLLQAERLGWFLVGEYGQWAMSDHPAWLGWINAFTRWQLKRQITDPVKRAAVTPRDAPGCKRVLFSNNYYPALNRDNVEVIPEGVAHIGPHSVTTSSGLEREVDTIIYATGFATHGFVTPMEITGLEGRRLEEDAWRGGASAYLGITVPDFPNLFLLYGPNTNLGSGSIVHILESAIRYAVDGVRHLAAHPGRAVSVRPGRYHLYDAEIQRRLSDAVWASGCDSWYVDENGRNANNWPGTSSEYRWRTRQFDPGDYEVLEAPVPETAEPVVA